MQKDLLGQADIENQPGGTEGREPDVKVRTLLRWDAKRIEGRFPDQRLTEAAIRLTIEDTYRALGEFPEAQPHLERSVQLRTVHLGGEHLATLNSKNALAKLYKEQDDYDRA